MAAVFCSRGHPNPGDNRFCYLCGEKLTSRAMQQDLILGDRYRVVRELGHGGFGRTYLAEDLNRFREACVLKEFAPQVQGTSSLQKAEELFEREAGILYGLHHPQIPRFRELFRAVLGDRSHLFLVQDYIPGETYGQLLQQRQQQGGTFREPEVCQLLTQILPVLTYLHHSGVIHRDISPDNLILRSSDGLPVLIDFGGVKQVSAAAELQFVPPAQVAPAATRLGKIGYAPIEQMQQGVVSPQSDLYALAVTVLVLLSGQEPTRLLEMKGTRPQWQRLVAISPALTQILQRMLASHADDRFRSADAVLTALQQANLVPAAHQLPLQVQENAATAHLPTAPIAEHLHSPQAISGGSPPGMATAPTAPQTIARGQAKNQVQWHQWAALGGVVLALGGAGWMAHDRWLPLFSSRSPSSQQGNRQMTPQQRSQSLGVDFSFLVQLTNQTFYTRYPDQQGRTLTNAPQDQELRKTWDIIAAEWLSLLETNLSETVRQKLGSYTKADRDRWKEQINQLYVSSRSLFDLTDARFFALFPDQQGQNFIDQPIGQVWHGMAAEQVKTLNHTALEKIQFAPGTFSQQVNGRLAPGTGRVFLANLSEGQIMRLNIQAASQSTLLSIYLPKPTRELPVLLEDSTDVTWTGNLPQSGYYEIVIVARGKTATDYQLNLAIDNVTSAPVEAARPEAPEAKN
ncbi:serine/threonine protein kinase [Leptolyngbya sp. GB1-A1]|uniref:serine/threonine-protein kinase n=1 Tax=Leptolyngbya sp. GB1-A1 TaxID=2933908 RepID=UPI003299C5F9